MICRAAMPLLAAAALAGSGCVWQLYDEDPCVGGPVDLGWRAEAALAAAGAATTLVNFSVFVSGHDPRCESSFDVHMGREDEEVRLDRGDFDGYRGSQIGLGTRYSLIARGVDRTLRETIVPPTAFSVALAPPPAGPGDDSATVTWSPSGDATRVTVLGGGPGGPATWSATSSDDGAETLTGLFAAPLEYVVTVQRERTSASAPGSSFAVAASVHVTVP